MYCLRMGIKSVQEKWSAFLIGDGSVDGIAFGIAVGTFVALLPTFGFSVFIALGLTLLFPQLNKPAVIFALAFWNPIVQIPVYGLSALLGNYLFGSLPVVMYEVEILNQIYNFTRRFLVAHLLVGTGLTLLMYVIGYFTVKRLYTSSQRAK